MEKIPLLYTSAYWQENLPGFSSGLYKEKSLITKECKESAITYQNLKITALPGQEITKEEVKKKAFWQNDPYPHLESQLLNRYFNVIGGKATFFGGEAKLWQHLEEAAQEIAQNHKVYLDLHNLTPTEAVLLIKELIRTKLNYDDLIAGYVNESKIQNNKVSTAKPEYLDFFTKNPKKYSRLTKQYSEKVDFMTADQILKHKYVVCRHISAVASILYEILRNNQDSILMNGSYLIYHDEKLEDQFDKACVGSHAYNILYVTHPKQKQIDVSLSVIDNTFTMQSDDFYSNPDYTHSRLSQACSSLFEYGHLFDIEKEKVAYLATLSAQKAKDRVNNFNHIFHFTETYQNLKTHNSDYLSLLLQRGDTHPLDTLYQSYKVDGFSRSEMLIDVIELPPIMYKDIIRDSLFIKNGWLAEVTYQLNQIDFSQKTDSQESLFEILTELAHLITSEDLQSNSGDLYMNFLTTYHQISKHF